MNVSAYILRRRIFSAIKYAIIILFLLVEIFPLIAIVTYTFTPLEDIGKTILFPSKWSMRNINTVLFASRFPRYFMNTVFVSVVIALGSMVINSFAAYAFARMRFPFKNLLFLILIATLIIPVEVLILPQYVLVSKLGWIDTYKALIVPALAGSFGIFFMRQFFMALPRELEEAAFIDGSGWLRTFWNIMLPLVKAPLLSLTLLNFVGVWDSFLWPMTVINSGDKHLVQVAVSLLNTEFFNDVGAQYANVFLSSLPLVLIFLLLQKQYIAGVTAGSVKG